MSPDESKVKNEENINKLHLNNHLWENELLYEMNKQIFQKLNAKHI